MIANPTNPSVVDGQAMFATENQLLTITTHTDKTILHWDDFSIGQDEITNIIQPNATSAILNRILSTSPSEILGTLKSNGEVILINPNGIYIGENGYVSVNALIASTLDVSNEEFLSGGDMTFSGLSEASIENHGLIVTDQGGIFLLGRHIINAKDIVAINSNVTLGAGSSILLKTDENKIYINPDISAHREDVGIENSGEITCHQAELKADGNYYGLAIRHTGIINALKATEVNGEIYLIADKGETRIEDQGSLIAEGGTIRVLGETVSLQDQTEISTTDHYQGGNIFIGGSFQGKDPTILSATNTTVGPDVLIRSNAVIKGDAGDVVIWANGTTEYRGTIRATAGTLQGNGALVEVSGLKNLFFKGIVDTRALNGQTGTLLLDPTDITISGAATAGGSFDGGSPTNTFSGSAAAATLNSGDLNTALQTNNVVVTTSSGIIGPVGNITIGATTTLNLATQSNTLTLLAENDIIVSSALSMSDTSGGTTSVLNLTAGNDITMTANITGGSLSAINFTTTSGDIFIDNDISAISATLNFVSGNDIETTGGGTIDLTANNINFTAANNILITEDITMVGNGASSNVVWSAVNQIQNNNLVRFTSWNSATLSVTSTGDFLIDNGFVATNITTLTLSSVNDIINQGGTNLFNDTIGDTTTLNLTATNDVIINSQIDINNFLACNITAGNDVIINNDFEPDNTTTVTVTAGSNIDIIDPAADILPVSVTTLNFIASNDFTTDMPFTVTNVDNVNITATNGDINLSVATINVTGANTTLTAGNDINILSPVINNSSGTMTASAGNDFNLGPSTIVSQFGTASGAVSVTTGRDLNITGGATTNDRSQIGFSASFVNSDINLTVGRDLILTAGSNSNSVTLIGHGFTSAGTYSGDIIIHSVGRDVTLSGDTGATGSVKFAQIGHTRFTSGTSTITGDIRGTAAGSPALITGTLTLNGGADTTSYTLFGHGGRDSNSIESYSGEVRVRANSITLNGGTSVDCFAAIGFFAVAEAGSGNGITVTTTSIVQAISDTTITFTGSTDGITSIGARALVDATHDSLIQPSLVDVQSSGIVTLNSGTGAQTEAFIGAYTDLGTANTNLTMTLGGDLLMNAGTGAPVRITNGFTTTVAKDTTISVTGDITPTDAGGSTSFIEGATGNLSVTATGTINLVASTRIENLGGSGGTLSFSAGTALLQGGGFIRNAGAGTSSIATTSSDFTIVDSSFVTSIGNLTGSIQNNLNILDDASLTVTGGTINLTTGADINLTASGAGDAFIRSSGAGTYLAGRRISLSGVSAVNEGFIENLAGNLQITSDEDIFINAFSRITNTGAGDLTIVVDNQAPTAPTIGNGVFDLSSFGSVGMLGGGLLRIFTAKRDQNVIAGTGNVNGATFTAGTLFVDTATEQWGTYFPSTFGGTPFTIFYKDDAPVPPTPPTPPTPPPSVADILAADPNAFISNSEVFYMLESSTYIDPAFAWLIPLIAINDMSEGEEYEEPLVQFSREVIPIKKLPPYIKKADLLMHR